MEPQMRKELPVREAICEMHGQYESVNFIGSHWSSCRTCAQEQERAAREKEERQVRRERTERHLTNSGLDGRFLECTFANYAATLPAQKKVLETCRGFVETVKWNGGGGLWLIGPPGTGKSHLGSAMVRHIIEERDHAAGIFSGREVIRMLRATWSRETKETEEQVLNWIGSLPLLVLDEIGVNFGSDAEHVQLFDVIDARYKHCRPTVLLSNLTTKEMKPMIGERAYDRLREGAQVLLCNWESYRRNPHGKQDLEIVK